MENDVPVTVSFGCAQEMAPERSSRTDSTLPTGIINEEANTRFIVLLGVTDRGDRAAPNEVNGQFFSDMCAVVHTIKGRSEHMVILVTEDCHPRRLVRKYAKTHPPGILHRDPHSEKVLRKIVCTEEMLENGNLPLENVQAYPMKDLKQKLS